MITKAELNNCRRILVLGSCGTGKSTFAKLLGKKLNLEIIHLDKYSWKPGWIKRDLDEFADIVINLILKEEWVMDGNYSMTLSIRASRADLIFMFDYPSWFSTYRILKRNVKTKLGFEKRTDLADGCYEKWFDREFIKFTWNFKRDYTPRTYKILEETNFDKNKFIVFNHYKEFKIFCKYLDYLL